VTPLKLERYQITVICDDMNFVAPCHYFPYLNLHEILLSDVLFLKQKAYN